MAGAIALPAFGAQAAKARKKADAAADAEPDPDADDPEKKLPPILLKALHEKEDEVVAMDDLVGDV